MLWKIKMKIKEWVLKALLRGNYSQGAISIQAIKKNLWEFKMTVKILELYNKIDKVKREIFHLIKEVALIILWKIKRTFKFYQ
jgi:hypothetical protein